MAPATQSQAWKPQSLTAGGSPPFRRKGQLKAAEGQATPGKASLKLPRDRPCLARGRGACCGVRTVDRERQTSVMTDTVCGSARTTGPDTEVLKRETHMFSFSPAVLN